MSDVLTLAREALVEQLEAAGLTAHAFLPTQVNADRAVVLAPADNYVSTSQDFGRAFVVTLTAYLLISPKNDRADSKALNALIVEFQAAARPWSITACDAPDVLTYGDWVKYGVAMTITLTL